MTDSLFQAVMSEAEVVDDMRLSFGEPTLDLLTTPPLNQAYAMVNDVWEARSEKRINWKFKTANYAEWAEIKKKTPEERADIAGLIGLRFIRTYFHLTKDRDVMWGVAASIYGAETSMISELCRSKLPFTEAHILALIHSVRSVHNFAGMTPNPLPYTLKAIEIFLAANPMSALMKDSLVAFKNECHEEKDRLASKLLQQTEDHLDSILTDHA